MPAPAICHVDFSGNLEAATCGRSLGGDFENTTVFLSAATCEGCKVAIQATLARMLEAERIAAELAGSQSLRGMLRGCARPSSPSPS